MTTPLSEESLQNFIDNESLEEMFPEDVPPQIQVERDASDNMVIYVQYESEEWFFDSETRAVIERDQLAYVEDDMVDLNPKYARFFNSSKLENSGYDIV